MSFDFCEFREALNKERDLCRRQERSVPQSVMHVGTDLLFCSLNYRFS